MELIIVRHADAYNIGEEGISTDRGRPLTPHGREQSRLVAKTLQTLRCRPDCVVCSPFQRARQTAQIIAAALRPGEEPETRDFLCPGAKARTLVEWLNAQPAETVVVVGHAPDVENMTSAILSRKEGLDIHFGKAAACCLTFDDSPCLGAGRLEWLIPARLMRGLITHRGTENGNSIDD